MRRLDKQISDPGKIEEILSKADVCRIALVDGDEPYIVPVNFGYADHSLYFHCARNGRKIDIIRKNNKVCIEADIDHEMNVTDTACEWGFKYRSVIGFGKAVIIDEAEAKTRALDIIMKHYSDKIFRYKEDQLSKILIIRVDIEKMTGKKSL